MTATARPRSPRRLRRILVTALVTFLTLLTIAVVSDSIVAAKVERSVSQRLWKESNLATPPSVQVSGMPFVSSLLTHVLPSVSVDARDVEVPGFARVSVTSSAQKVTLTREEILSGSFTDAPARKVFTRLQLDAVALGELLAADDGRSGMDDLHIQGVEDISPAGGWETEAQFTATPGDIPGVTGPVKVDMRLRVWEGDVRILPTKIVSVDGDRSRGDGGSRAPDPQTRDQIMEAFTLELPGESLPMHSRPGRVYVNGGALYIETEQNFTRVSLSDLAPVSAPLAEDDRAGL
ncbi:LmeA family phospholipid-binding protein [Corynebacterium provencense]|uniref:LmeA family phospholipid-binding protein n=1 Tax=Corynebacterium provencense TaxID=1737425 RepID=UPI001D131806|nr:DUF2993 domain-containing protein [Corynebacterium provencense]